MLLPEGGSASEPSRSRGPSLPFGPRGPSNSRGMPSGGNAVWTWLWMRWRWLLPVASRGRVIASGEMLFSWARLTSCHTTRVTSSRSVTIRTRGKRLALLARRLGLGASFVIGVSPSASASPVVEPLIVQRYPHDPAAFTEGLLLHDGELFESTGLLGASSLRRVALVSGEVQDRVTLPDSEFGEGLALASERLIQLTWQNGVAHVYDATTLRAVEDFAYSGEGWGLCHDGKRLIMSDGSDRLFFRDPLTFELQGSVSVRDEGNAVRNLNELECVGGDVFANVWLTDVIVRISAASGEVLTTVDAAALRTANGGQGGEVLNGIAFDRASGHFLLTGKYWPSLFEVELPLPSLELPSSPLPEPNHVSCAMTRRPYTSAPLLAGFAALAGIRALCRGRQVARR
jgi:glutamine cyclotransferase